MEKSIVKKISSKLMVGNIVKADNGYLYSIIGKVTGIKTGESNYGSWIGFKGEFEAWNDKVSCRSNLCFLPEIISIPLEVAVSNKDEDITFGIEIHKKENDSVVGFEYEVKTIIPLKESNMLSDLRKTFDTAPYPEVE